MKKQNVKGPQKHKIRLQKNIQTHSNQNPNSTKENLNLNDIHQSTQKLHRTKSSRKDHSLETKEPLKITSHFHQFPSKFQRNLSFRQTTSKNETNRNFFNELNQKQFNNENSHDVSKVEMKCTNDPLKTNSLTSLYELIQMHNKMDLTKQNMHEQIMLTKNLDSKQSQYEPVSNLLEEKIALQFIKIVWDEIGKMKSKKIFLMEMEKLEKILKSMIMKIAKPKILKSTASSKIFAQAVQQPNNFFNLQSLQNNEEQSLVSLQSQRVPREKIEMKKIMYILQEKGKNLVSKPNSQESKLQNQNCVEKEIVETYENLQTPSQKQNRNLKEYDSTFNRHSRTNSSGITIYEIEKEAIDKNQRVFLKNIVKKTNNISNQNHFQTEANPDFCIEFNKQSRNNSKKLRLENESYDSMKESEQFSEQASFKFEYQTEPQQSKRKVLNDIIGMLNKKYNKNIMLQPLGNR